MPKLRNPIIPSKTRLPILLTIFLASLVGLGTRGGVFQNPTPAFLLYAVAHVLLYLLIFKLGPGNAQLPHLNPLSDHSSEDPNVKVAHSDYNDSESDIKLSLDRVAFSGAGILIISVILRIAFVGYPLSDDVNRYAWEGFIQTRGVNPYVHAPSEFSDEFGADPLYANINHKNIPAIYPPLSLLSFRLISMFSSTVGIAPVNTLTVYKFFFLVCDILVVLTLLKAAALWGVPRRWTVLYAWNPLVLLYGAGEGHIDILQNLFLALMLLTVAKPKPAWPSGFFFLGCAVMTKYLAFIILPFLISRKNLRASVFFAIPFLLYIPFLQGQIFEAITVFSNEMHYNEFLPRLIRYSLSGAAYSYAISFCFFAGLGCIWIFKQDAPQHGITLAWMWLVLCIPTVHPWYLLPVALFLVFHPSRAWLLLFATLGLTFWTCHEQWENGQWTEIPWVWYGVYIPFVLVLIRDFLRATGPWHKTYSPPNSIDIVIPTLNEEKHIAALLEHIRAAEAQLKEHGRDADDNPLTPGSSATVVTPEVNIFVVDGGSTDRTVEIAEASGARTSYSSPRSRGGQIAAGTNAGSGELVVILHADAIIHRDALVRTYQTLVQNPAAQWGILGHTYDCPSIKMQIIELSNRLRFRFAGIAFGDQGIFARRSIINKIGGVPSLPLMEDVELSLRLAAYPCRLNLGGLLVISTRRWQRKKFTGYTFQVFRLVSTFLIMRRLGANTAQLSERMYRSYYKDTAA